MNSSCTVWLNDRMQCGAAAVCKAPNGATICKEHALEGVFYTMNDPHDYILKEFRKEG